MASNSLGALITYPPINVIVLIMGTLKIQNFKQLEIALHNALDLDFMILQCLRTHIQLFRIQGCETDMLWLGLQG